MALLSMVKPSQPKARKVYNNCSRSVVKISTVRLEWDPYRQLDVQVPGCGSGFVWNREFCFLVTCDHVIHDVFEFSITLGDESDGIMYKAKVVYSDRETDVAILHVDAPKDKLWPVTAGDSDMVHVGDEVCAIGTPFGYQNSLSTGVISGVKREVHPRGRRPMQGLLQTNAALNPGNSGGPLLDIHGKVIGMNTCINASPSGTSTGVGFAVPVNVISEIVDKMVMVKSANNTKPNSRIELLPYHSGECHIDNVDFVNGSCVGAKMEHCRHSPHDVDDIIGYIRRGVSRPEEGFNILRVLMKSGLAKMHNGNVIVCRGCCEECRKMDLDILPSDHVEKFGVGRTHPIDVDSDERCFGWRERLRLWKQILWLCRTKRTLNDPFDQRETYEKEAPSYQSGPISGNQFDASPLLGLHGPSPTNDPSGKVVEEFSLDRISIMQDLQGSQLLEVLLKYFICCCPAST